MDCTAIAANLSLAVGDSFLWIHCKIQPETRILEQVRIRFLPNLRSVESFANQRRKEQTHPGCDEETYRQNCRFFTAEQQIGD